MKSRNPIIIMIHIKSMTLYLALGDHPPLAAMDLQIDHDNHSVSSLVQGAVQPTIGLIC